MTMEANLDNKIYKAKNWNSKIFRTKDLLSTEGHRKQ